MRSFCFRLRSLAKIIGILGIAGIARSETITTYDGFATTTGLTLNGSAAVAATADGNVLRLTPAQGNQSGSAFSTDRVSTDEFTSVFSFRITDPGGNPFDGNISNGADGFVFAVQNVANDVGASGSGIGFQGISPSIGVAFDTWLNPQNNDPSQNYIGIDLDGNVTHGPANGPTVTLPSPELGAGDRWWSWVVYDSHTLSVYLLQSDSATAPARPEAAVLSYGVDLGTLLGSSTAFAGFTSATGLDSENHDILYWSYTPSVPEPSTLVLATISTVTALFCACRRRRAGIQLRRARDHQRAALPTPVLP